MDSNPIEFERGIRGEIGEQLYSVLKELLILKRNQRAIEERLIKSLSRPVHRKWMDERVLDQYKHERIIRDISREYLGKEIELENARGTGSVYSSLTHELFNRLETVGNNIQFISNVTQPIDDFKIYKKLNAMISDEYIYQNRLIMMLTDK